MCALFEISNGAWGKLFGRSILDIRLHLVVAIDEKS